MATTKRASESVDRVLASLRRVGESLDRGSLLPDGDVQRLSEFLEAVRDSKAAKAECELLIAYLGELAAEVGASPADLGWGD